MCPPHRNIEYANGSRIDLSFSENQRRKESTMKITTTSCSILFLLVIIQIQHILAQEYAKMVTFSIEVDGVPKSMDMKFEDDVDVAARTFCQSIDNVEDSCHKTLAFHIYSQFAEENAKLQRQDISVQYARIMLSLDPELIRWLRKYTDTGGRLNWEYAGEVLTDTFWENEFEESTLRVLSRKSFYFYGQFGWGRFFNRQPDERRQYSRLLRESHVAHFWNHVHTHHG